MKINFINRFLLVTLLMVSSTVAFGQPDPGDDPDVPLDGGVSLILIAGAAFGAKKIHDAKKENVL